MKRFLVVAFCFAFLSACSKGGQETPAAAMTSQATPDLQQPVVAEADDSGLDILLDRGISFPFAYSVNYDIKDVSSHGTPRRRVLVEVLEPDFSSAAEAFEEALVSSGYASATSKNSTNDRIERVLTQSGKPTYYLLMQSSAAGPKLKDSASTGSIHIMWNQR